MAKKCYKCGKSLGFLSKKYEYEEDGKTICFCDGCDKKFKEKEKIAEKKKKAKRETEKKREEEKLLKSIEDELERPIIFGLSKVGFPICPCCKEEFKNEEAIIKHLIKNKKEFEEIKDLKDEEYENFKDLEAIKKFKDDVNKGRIKNPYLKQVVLKEIGPEKYFQRGLDNYIGCTKLVRAVKEYKHNKWKEELKPKKIKRRESPISPRLRFEILKRDHFTCQYCGRKPPEVELEVDHVEPYSKTKDSSPENLITACKECNRGKRIKEVI